MLEGGERQRRRRRGAIGLCAIAGLVLVASCRAPTQITVLVRTDVPCDKVLGTAIRVASLSGLAGAPVAVNAAHVCVEGRVGTLVVVPSGSRDAEVAIEVTLGFGNTTAAACVGASGGPECIVARRALSFVEHTELDLPIDLRLDCAGRPCDDTHTCVHGQCVDAHVQSSSRCQGEACADSSFGVSSDGGLTDGDVAVDAGKTDVGDGGAADAPDGDGGLLDADAGGPITALKIVGRGEFHCALLSDHTVSCWGENGEGQLGDGTIGSFRNHPARVLAKPGAPLGGVTDLAAGTWHVCAKKDDGTVVCWGRGADGQLGDGAFTQSSFPTTVIDGTGAPVKGIGAMAGGNRDTCAIMSDASVWCWGHFAPSKWPGPPSGGTILGAVVLGMGDDFLCVRAADSTISCFGYNADGELGDGTQATRDAPAYVSDSGGGILKSFRGVAGGDFFTCADLVDDSVVCWGSNGSGAIGDGSGISSPVLNPFPVQTKVGGPALTGVKFVAAGSGYVCAGLADGGVTCWGRNGEGALGDGSSGNERLSPVRTVGVGGVGLLGDVVELAPSNASTCARTKSGLVYCWGQNTLGQVGDGSSATERTTPTLVTLP